MDFVVCAYGPMRQHMAAFYMRLETQGSINLRLGDGAFAEDLGLEGKAVHDG